MASIGPSFFPPLGPATAQQPIDPKGWDRCTLAGRVVPAHCKILNADVVFKLDKKSSNGSDGSNPTIRGMDPQPLMMEIMTYNDGDREQLASLLGPYIPVPGTKPKPVAIDHPSLRMIRVYAVIIQGASALIPIEGTTKAKMTLHMQHWLPSRNKDATHTPKGAPVRIPSNNRKRADQDNPPPSKQGKMAAPPAKLGNGQ